MGKPNKFKSRKKSSLKRKVKILDLRSKQREPLIVFSFRDFDVNQGQNFEDWEEDKILALMINKLKFRMSNELIF